MRPTPSLLALLLTASGAAGAGPQDHHFRQTPEALLSGEVMAVAYSGFREGQHPDRGSGAVNPSEEEILEDLGILWPWPYVNGKLVPLPPHKYPYL